MDKIIKELNEIKAGLGQTSVAEMIGIVIDKLTQHKWTVANCECPMLSQKDWKKGLCSVCNGLIK